MANTIIFENPTNYVQYALPFKAGSISQVNKEYTDVFMIDNAELTQWQGIEAVNNLPSNNKTYVYMQDGPPEDEKIIHHLIIYANNGCEFYITNYECFSAGEGPPPEEIEGNPDEESEKKWYSHIQKYQIGASNQLEFINVRICSVGSIDNQNSNSEEYFGKNALLDIAITTMEEAENLYRSSENAYMGDIDPFQIEVEDNTEG